jgi:hypothetical protein
LVQVRRIEVSCFQKLGPIENTQFGSRRGDEAIMSELLKRSVYVNRRDAHGVAKDCLGDWQVDSVVLDKPDKSQADDKLAKDVGHPGVGFSSADIGDPFPKYGSVDQRRPPKGSCYTRVLFANGANGIMPDQSQLTWRDGGKGAVHHTEMHSMQIWNVACNKEANDLPLTLTGVFVCTHEAFQDGEAIRRPIALQDNILVCPKVSLVNREASQSRLIVIPNFGDALKFSDDQFRRRDR